MNAYQAEQREALEQTRDYLKALSPSQLAALKEEITPYLAFRRRVDRFLADHFSAHCRMSCYANHRSACCSKNSIITFWADGLINACCSSDVGLAPIVRALQYPRFEHKCVYLGVNGCLWRVRPLVCAMFLCDPVQTQIFGAQAGLQTRWQAFQDEAKGFRWPDRPVLFDALERRCMAAGYHSSLMYLNQSPGLLRLKRKVGLI